jgi:PAS domain S-box-containing protein
MEEQHGGDLRVALPGTLGEALVTDLNLNDQPQPHPPFDGPHQPAGERRRPADRQTLHLFEQAVATAESGIVIADAQQADLPVIYVNPAFERLTGYTADEVIGRNCRFLQGDDRDQPAREVIRAALAEGRPATVLLRNYRRDGTLFWNELHLAPVRDTRGQVTHVVGVQIDVTEHRAAEARLRLLADAGLILLRQGDERAALADLAERLVPALVDWCAIDLTEGGSPRRAVARHRQAALTPLVQALPLGPLLTDAPVVQQGALHDRWTDAAARAAIEAIGLTACISLPLRLETRRFGYMVVAVSTPGRVLGPAEATIFGELAQRITLMLETARLRRMAAQAARQRDEFLSSISHELKTPITAIKGVAQILQRRLEHGQTISANKLLHDLQAIDTAASRLTATISQLLDVARVREGQPLPLERVPTDLVLLLRRLVERQQAVSDRHVIRLATTLDHLVGAYDAGRLTHALSNLLTNATIFSPDGGLVAVALEQDTVDDQPWAVITIADAGIGIPANDLPHIFERYHRAGNVPPQTPGSGLGLASARQIIESHGGHIAVTSQEGAGTTFTLRLPVLSTEY